MHGDLLIYNAEECMVATLERPRVDDRRLQVLYPLFDVRVRTLGDGLMVLATASVPIPDLCANVGKPGSASQASEPSEP